MHLGIAPSLRLEIASNLGLPIVHVISSQALSDEQRSHGAKAPGQIESVISLRTLKARLWFDTLTMSGFLKDHPESAEGWSNSLRRGANPRF
jgi:hypothetical protein